MKNYLNLVEDVLNNGFWQGNRTGIRTLNLPGAMLRFDLKDGFPAVTTKKLAFKTAVGELLGFFRAYRSAADFRALGCKVWDQNANENKQWLANPFRLGENDLGAVYGVQWREWPAYKVIDVSLPGGPAQVEQALKQGYSYITMFDDITEEGKVSKVLMYKAIDQLRTCLDTIMTNPDDRRILFHGWNCAQIDEMALPPCHLLYQFLPNAETKELSVCMYLRSSDLGLGLPFNVAELAVLLHIVARLTGYTPRVATVFIASAHIYENHVEMLQEQLKREPFPAPRLVISERVPAYAETGVYAPEWLEQLTPADFSLEGYQHHAPLTAAMAV